jgi:hypothetical protein
MKIDNGHVQAAHSYDSSRYFWKGHMKIRALPQPTRRPLKIFAFDPMLGRTAGNKITIDIPNEKLSPGPQGERLEVIDYDGPNKCFYPPIDLDDRVILMQGGLEPTESDPRFHQQMVYAVATKVIENFEQALGRKLQFRNRPRPHLRLYPHAFHGENAFYDSREKAIFFGYFHADKKNPGPNLPGQTVFTCLSHDVIAHEMTHALVDRLREHFMEPSNRDVAAFHEGFSDIIAIFQHFSFPEILRNAIQSTRGNLRDPTPLLTLAQQFGYATGKGQALRSAFDTSEDPARVGKPDPKLYETATEPHERGSILVTAVFEAFYNTYRHRISDLIRIATAGSGRLPEGDIHPDLVLRIAGEAAQTAQAILTMCVRAFEYLPPVDITFGDYLRALITADYELAPDDPAGQRAAMIEAFRTRGVFPLNVTSLAEDSLLWEPAPSSLKKLPVEVRRQIMLEAQFFKPLSSSRTGESPETPDSLAADASSNEAQHREFVQKLKDYANANPVALGLDPDVKTHPIQVQGFHSVFRVASNRQLLVELVAQFTQTDVSQQDHFGGVPFRGGTTLVAASNGQVRYIISKPLPRANPSAALPETKRKEAKLRLEMQRAFRDSSDRDDSYLAWSDERYQRRRIARTMNFQLTHQRNKKRV